MPMQVAGLHGHPLVVSTPCYRKFRASLSVFLNALSWRVQPAGCHWVTIPPTVAYQAASMPFNKAPSASKVGEPF